MTAITHPVPAATNSPDSHRAHAVLIVGGSAAGITVAALLRRHRPGLSVAVIEPSDTHSYQPGWTLVGGGVFSRGQTCCSGSPPSCRPCRRRWTATASG